MSETPWNTLTSIYRSYMKFTNPTRLHNSLTPLLFIQLSLFRLSKFLSFHRPGSGNLELHLLRHFKSAESDPQCHVAGLISDFSCSAWQYKILPEVGQSISLVDRSCPCSPCHTFSQSTLPANCQPERQPTRHKNQKGMKWTISKASAEIQLVKEAILRYGTL